jgi:peptide/nickel transport system permease protein
MTDITDTPVTAESEAERRRKEAYFTASQAQLIWARFRKQRAAMVGATVLLVLILMGVFAPFLSPYDPTIAGRDKEYEYGAPQIPKFWDDNGFSARPFIYTVERERSIKTNFRWVTKINKDKRRYVQFFVDGWEYSLIDIALGLPGRAFKIELKTLTFSTHLFGVDEGGIHLFGTDVSGKDIFSRTLHSIYTSLAVGTIGVVIAFVLALVIGGISGYYGGWIDGLLQMITDAVRTVPAIPLFMALAAFVPDEWSAELRFLFISTILGLIGWPTLAALRRLIWPHHSPPPAAQFHQLHHRRSGDLLPLHGAVGNRAQLYRAGAQRPGEQPGRDASERLQGGCSPELSVALYPGDLLYRTGAGLRLCRGRSARCG